VAKIVVVFIALLAYLEYHRIIHVVGESSSNIAERTYSGSEYGTHISDNIGGTRAGNNITRVFNLQTWVKTEGQILSLSKFLEKYDNSTRSLISRVVPDRI
jgi:hypothetical protein